MSGDACAGAVAARRSPARIREISEECGIPERYLVQILLHLKGAGLVASCRGAAGGYRLARPASTISLGAVLAAIDGPDVPARAPLRPAAQALAAVWEQLRRVERTVLETTSIAQIAEFAAPHEWVI